MVNGFYEENGDRISKKIMIDRLMKWSYFIANLYGKLLSDLTIITLHIVYYLYKVLTSIKYLQWYTIWYTNC